MCATVSLLRSPRRPPPRHSGPPGRPPRSTCRGFLPPARSIRGARSIPRREAGQPPPPSAFPPRRATSRSPPRPGEPGARPGDAGGVRSHLGGKCSTSGSPSPGWDPSPPASPPALPAMENIFLPSPSLNLRGLNDPSLFLDRKRKSKHPVGMHGAFVTSNSGVQALEKCKWFCSPVAGGKQPAFVWPGQCLGSRQQLLNK